MDELNRRVGENLKRLRSEKGLSLDAVAGLTGVSKSMLGQVERGETNPTISTVWRIASGLKVTFTALVSEPSQAHELVRLADVEPLVEDEGRVRNRPVFSFDPQRGFEMYVIEFDPGGHLSADAHPAGVEEIITVCEGRLHITAGEVDEHLEPGDSIRFRADVPHAYTNAGSCMTRISMLIRYSA